KLVSSPASWTAHSHHSVITADSLNRPDRNFLFWSWFPVRDNGRKRYVCDHVPCGDLAMNLRLLASLFLSAVSFAQSSGTAPATMEARVAGLEASIKSAQSAGDNAWMLVSAALVLMMTGPGLALFYGGLVRKKNVLGTMMQSFILMALVTVL